MSDIHISPWLIPTPFVLLALLVACSGSVSDESKPKIREAAKVQSSIGSAITEIEEICYEGVVYIVNGRGGMAPKMYASAPNNATLCK